MKTLTSVLMGVGLCYWSGLAADQAWDLVLEFGDVPKVTDLTPKPGPFVNNRWYAPGRPPGTSVRLPLAESRIHWTESAAPTVEVLRERTWTCCEGLWLPPQGGREGYAVTLKSDVSDVVEKVKTWLQQKAQPAVFPLAAGSKLSYVQSDPAYIGGGPFGNGGWDTTVIAYDVEVVSIRMTPSAAVVAPPLIATRKGESVELTWSDSWGSFEVESSTSLTGPWKLAGGAPNYFNGVGRLTLTPTSGQFFRLKTRSSPR